MNLKEIGERLKKTRKALKLKQEEFSQRLEFSKTSISDYETGKKKPHFDFLVNLSRHYNINLHYILFGKGGMFLGEGGVPGVAGEGTEPFGELTSGILKIIDTMKVSRYARYGIYTLAKEFLYKNKELISHDIHETTAGAGGNADTGANDAIEKEITNQSTQ